MCEAVLLSPSVNHINGIPYTNEVHNCNIECQLVREQSKWKQLFKKYDTKSELENIHTHTHYRQWNIISLALALFLSKKKLIHILCTFRYEKHRCGMEKCENDCYYLRAAESRRFADFNRVCDACIFWNSLKTKMYFLVSPSLCAIPLLSSLFFSLLFSFRLCNWYIFHIICAKNSAHNNVYIALLVKKTEQKSLLFSALCILLCVNFIENLYRFIKSYSVFAFSLFRLNKQQKKRL